MMMNFFAVTTMKPMWIHEIGDIYEADQKAENKITALLLNEQSEPDLTCRNGLLKLNLNCTWVLEAG